jgi:hypothetical protein
MIVNSDVHLLESLVETWDFPRLLAVLTLCITGLYDLASELGVKIVGCDRELRGRDQSPHESWLVYGDIM